MTSTVIGSQTFSSSCGCVQLVDALVDREEAADREQDDRHDERVDVALAAVAERVLAVGRFLRLAAAEQQQQLVAGVGEGVDALGEHRGRAREEPRDELGQGDAHVRQERRDDRLAAAGCTHATSLRIRRGPDQSADLRMIASVGGAGSAGRADVADHRQQGAAELGRALEVRRVPDALERDLGDLRRRRRA